MDERIIKYCQGVLPKQEQDQLLKEAYNDPKLKSQIIDYQHLHSLLELVPEKADMQQGSERYGNFKRLVNSRKRKVWLISFSRYAAIIVIVFVSAWMLASYCFSGDITNRQELIAFQQELVVPAGQRAELTLPDGTKVWLNAGSKLSYPSFFEKERKVFLSGEGFFDVSKNKKVPFIVSTRTMDVKALGTQFNVFCYPESNYTGVYLQEGSVKAYFPSSEAEGVILSPEQYLVQKGKQLVLSTMDPDELLWREGIYTFKRQKLGRIIEKLELYYDVKIVVKDPEILDYEYVGKFRQRDGVMEILHLIQRIHNFKIKKNDELNQIILSK
ncbi:FecR domain-containing protein [Parabacteroides sp. GYB001]|uniref:FecR family protein n=2 Tax=Parabacteroides leei TaxID=2939491 RepID=UPI002018129B|nr:FecR domain-containing protein [Parabacteroides leei]MCL3854467.1 FecR domain-containing protein [Parabacteroides leei]